MCGLLLSIRLISDRQHDQDPTFDALLTSVTPRGPDSLQVHISFVTLTSGETLEVKLAASVLGLRGANTVAQPLEGSRGVLGWNGQVFQGLNISIGDNDTIKLFERLEQGETPSGLLSSIEGP
jgi:asparagine synthetase B (glutamine-hydrolysing)